MPSLPPRQSRKTPRRTSQDATTSVCGEIGCGAPAYGSKAGSQSPPQPPTESRVRKQRGKNRIERQHRHDRGEHKRDHADHGLYFGLKDSTRSDRRGRDKIGSVLTGDRQPGKPAGQLARRVDLRLLSVPRCVSLCGMFALGPFQQPNIDRLLPFWLPLVQRSKKLSKQPGQTGRVPRTVRTIQISKHAPTNPEIR